MEDQTCTCLATNHGHAPNRCEEPPTAKGGVCTHCRYFASRPRKSV